MAAGNYHEREAIVRDLRRLGVRRGQTLLVHASMRMIGRVKDGARGVVDSLREAVGLEGTLVVPTGTADNSDSSRLHLAKITGMTADET